MKTLRRFLHAGFAACALAGASLPALSSAPWPDTNFKWYPGMGKGGPATTTALPAPRGGYIWAPAHYEWNGIRMEYIPGIWIQDNYENEWRMYARGPNAVYAAVRPDANVNPFSPDPHPVEAARR
jgi:hypothetical protein